MLSSVGWISIVEVGQLIWIDFIHNNPHRPQSNALSMILTSPIFGLLGTLVWNFIPAMVAAAVIATAVQIYRRAPWPVIVIVEVLCSSLTLWLWTGTVNAGGNDWQLLDVLWRIAEYQGPVWVVSWLLLIRYYSKFLEQSADHAMA